MTPTISCRALPVIQRDLSHRESTAPGGPRIEFDVAPAQIFKRLGVVGAGPAGLAFAIQQAAARGHRVVLFEAAPEIGGQLNLASRIPGKCEPAPFSYVAARQIAPSEFFGRYAACDGEVMLDVFPLW